MKKTIKLSVQEAQKLYNENASLRELLLTTFTKEELEGVAMKSWWELGLITGCFVTTSSKITEKDVYASHCNNKHIFATKKQAISALAMAQLSQLMADLGDECDVDWEDVCTKHCIYRVKSELKSVAYDSAFHFLAFKTAKVRDAFLTKHDGLIKQYFML